MQLTVEEIAALKILAENYKIVYINSGIGVGQLYLNGKKVEGLREVSIDSLTNDLNICFPNVKIDVNCQKFNVK